MNRLWRYLKQQKGKLMLVIVCIILSTVLSVLSPILMQIAIDRYLVLGNMKVFFYVLAILLCFYLCKSVFTFLSNYIMASISEKTLYAIRRDLFIKLESLDLSFFDQNQNGDLMSRFTNDITMINDALTEFIVEIISSVLILIGVTFMMFSLNSILAVLVILTVPFFFFCVYKIGMRANESFLKQQETLGKLTGISEELVTGMKEIHARNQEEKSFQKFKKENERLRDISIRAQLYSGLILPVNLAITNFSNIILLFMSSLFVLNGQMTIGMILAFLNYASMFRSPINNLASLFTSLGSALAGAKRIFEILEEEPCMIDQEDMIPVTHIDGDIVFDQVEFSYGSHKVFEQLSFVMKAGMSVAIVGPTGAGKTSIANLLTCFYPFQKGNIKVDSNNLTDLKISDLRKKIGIVLQDPYLFVGTVKDNIGYGKESASLQEIIQASKQVGAHDFIHRLPDGYSTIIEENGSNISEGERQLIAIARVMLANPDLLILDEATSHIDPKTENTIQRGMQELRKGKTSLIIAHRLSTIQQADLILVVDHGQIVESGAHDQLLQKHGFYHMLYMSQFENEKKPFFL